ncbi:MAG: peptidoglycan-binding domain-containing protein [Acidimicrobiales bacterium]
MDFFDAPMFEEAPDERLEKAASAGRGPARLAARTVLAVGARSHRTPDAARVPWGSPLSTNDAGRPEARINVTSRRLVRARRGLHASLWAAGDADNGDAEAAWQAFATSPGVPGDQLQRLTALLERPDSLARRRGGRTREAPARPRGLRSLQVAVVVLLAAAATSLTTTQLAYNRAGLAVRVTGAAAKAISGTANSPLPSGGSPLSRSVTRLARPGLTVTTVGPARSSVTSLAGAAASPRGPSAVPLAARPTIAQVVAAAKRAPLPVGTGVWIWTPAATAGGDVAAIVAQAEQSGLTHLYAPISDPAFFQQLLPAAHAAGLKVIGWDLPNLRNINADVATDMAAIDATAGANQHLDGLASDISPATAPGLDAAAATAYGTQLRQAAGPAYPLIAVVPQPATAPSFPYRALLGAFDAVAPTVVWGSGDPTAVVQATVSALAPYGKPILPIAQAFTNANQPGNTVALTPAQITAFIVAARHAGSVGASFWSWQTISAAQWQAIASEKAFALPASLLSLGSGQLRAYQAELSSLGYPVAISGLLDQATVSAITAYQHAASLPADGILNDITQSALLAPVPLG